nr:RNA polymerase [Flumine tombus-like virus 24]
MKERNFNRLSGFGGHKVFGMHNNALANLRRGLIERVFYVEGGNGELLPTPKPLAGQFTQLNNFLAKVRKHDDKFYSPVTRERFLMYYRGRKLGVYTRAVESLQHAPLVKKDARLKTFVKAEKINFTAKPDPAPRVIQPRSPRYNVELGVFIRPHEKRMIRMYNDILRCGEGEDSVMKGMNMEQRGVSIAKKWNRFTKPVAVGLDAKRFDQHVSQDALRFEHSIYNTLFKSKKLKALLNMQLSSEGIGFATDGMIRYRVDGCRMSGDMNTSLGNISIVVAIFDDLRAKSGIDFELVNDGDDNVVICESKDLAEITLMLRVHFLNFGFQMAIEEPVYMLEKIEFCQAQPVFDGEKYIMCRNPSTCLSKDVATCQSIDSPKMLRQWMAAVGQCGLSLTGGLPVMQDFYKCLSEQDSEMASRKAMKNAVFIESGLFRHSETMFRVFAEPTTEARVSFYHAFGLMPELQLALEAHYKNLVFDSESTSHCKTKDKTPESILNGFERY